VHLPNCPTTETPYIPIEFAVAAYRFGHSMMPQKIQVQQGANAFELFGTTLDRSYLGQDRSWDPYEDGVGVGTLGEMLTFASP
jgi:hypothetical protein